jgi:hypothetical protein
LHIKKASLFKINIFIVILKTVTSDACYGEGFKPATNAFHQLVGDLNPADETDN